MEVDNNKNSKGHTHVQWGVTILVNMIVFNYGVQSGWLSPMTKVLQTAESPAGRPLTDSETTMIAGTGSLTAMAGIPILTYIVDRFGRKCALIVMCFFQLMCWIIKIFTAAPAGLLVARMFCGLGAGGCFLVVPLYIKEISQDNIRGTLGTIFALFQNGGLLVMYTLGAYLNYYTVLYVVMGLPVLTMALIIFKAPESPSFLVKIGKIEDAAAIIVLLRGLNRNDKEVQMEIDSIKREDAYFKSIPNISFFKIFKEQPWRRGFIIIMVIIVLHACNGAFAILINAASLLSNSDLEISPELQTLGIPVFMTIGTLFTMYYVDRLGRKVLLGVTFVVSGLAFLGLGSVEVLRTYGWTTSGWVSVAAVMMVVCCYGAGVNPIPCIISAEIFNFQIRAKLMGLLSFLAWFVTFIQLVSYTAINNYLGTHVTFYTFCLANFLAAAVVVVFLPETKGKTIEQIEAKLRKGN